MAVLDSLLVELGFDYDPKDLNEFKTGMASTTKIVKRLATAVVGAATAITGMVTVSTAATDEQGKFADKIGESVENLDALQFALVRSGGSADGMNSSLESLSVKAAEAARGVGAGVEAFGILGIEVQKANGGVKSASELMTDVSGALSGLGKAEQIELAEKLGLSSALPLLQQGPQAINELVSEAKALGVTTAEDAAVAAEFQDSLTDIFRVVKDVARALTKNLAPILNDIAQTFLIWWKTNRDIIQQKLPLWIEKAAMAMRLLTVAVAAFMAFRMVSTFISLIGLLKGATLATMGMNAAMLLIPALIAAAAVAFVALVEDAKVFFEGGESVIGDMIKKFPEWEGAITTVAAALATVWDLTKMIFDGWSQIIELFKSFSLEGVKEVLGDIPGFLGDVTGLAPVEGGGILSGVGTSISNAASTAVDKIDIVIQGGADTAENIANSVFNIFQQTTQDLNSAVDQ